MRRTKEEAEQTRQAILDAAVDVFTDRGVAKATLEGVAKAANVTRGAVYWHFKNKREIFDALRDRLHSPFIQRVLEGLEVEHPDPIGQLQEICTNLLVELDDDEQKRKALTLFLLKCDYSGELAESQAQFNEQKKQKIDSFCRYFEKAQEQGKLAEGADPKMLTIAMNCYLRGIVIEYLETPDEFDIRTYAPALIDLFFKPLKRNV